MSYNPVDISQYAITTEKKEPVKQRKREDLGFFEKIVFDVEEKLLYSPFNIALTNIGLPLVTEQDIYNIRKDQINPETGQEYTTGEKFQNVFKPLLPRAKNLPDYFVQTSINTLDDFFTFVGDKDSYFAQAINYITQKLGVVDPDDPDFVPFDGSTIIDMALTVGSDYDFQKPIGTKLSEKDKKFLDKVARGEVDLVAKVTQEIQDVTEGRFLDENNRDVREAYTGDGFINSNATDKLLGVVGAVTGTLETVIPAIVTRGKSLGPQIVLPMLNDYNKNKAEYLYGKDDPEALKKLIENDEYELATPASLALLSYSLEKMQFKGISDYITKQGFKPNRLAKLLSLGSVNGTQEAFQFLVDKINEDVAKGGSLISADNNSIAKVFSQDFLSEEFFEQFLMGFVGGTSTSVTGSAINRAFKSDEPTAKKINEYINEISSIRNQIKTSKDDLFISKAKIKLKNVEEEFSNFISKNNKLSEYLNSDEITQVQNILKNKDKNRKEEEDLYRSFKSGKITKEQFNLANEVIQNERDQIDKDLNTIKIDANKRKLREDLGISGEAISQVKGLKQIVYNTKQKFLDAYNEKSGKNYTLEDIEGVDGLQVGNEMLINEEVAAENYAVTVGSHEFLHGIVKSSITGKLRNIKDKDGNVIKDANGKNIQTDLTEEGEILIRDFLKTLSSNERKVVQKRIDDNYRYNRDKDGKIISEKQFAEYAEDYLNAYSDASIKNELNTEFYVKIARFFSKIFNSGSRGFKNLQFKTGKDAKVFLDTYTADRKKGRFRKQFIEMAQEGVGRESMEKKSLSSEAKQQITENVKEIGDTYSFEGGKKSWDEGGADNAITEIKQNNYLDDLIAAKFKGDRVPIDFVDKVYTELTNHIRNFNPETNDNLFGWINSQLANKAGNVFNREYKTTTEQRTARDVDDRTKEGEVKVQVADETDVTLEALETEDISPQAEARRKREAAKKEEPTKSQLRQEIGIEDGSDAYNTILETARKVLIRAYDAGKTARQIQRDLTKEASTYLFKQVKNMLGTKAKYIPTIKKLRVALINSMFTSDLVQMERNVADDQRVFTKFVGKLTSKQEVQNAVDNNLLPPSALNTIDKGQSVNLYEKVMPTEEQFVAFFDQPLVNPKTGVRSGLRGTRKDQLAKYVAASLNFDATMQVAQETEVAEKRQQIAELRGETIDDTDIQILSATINRKPNLKFSKSSDRPVVSQNLGFHLEELFSKDITKNKKLTQKDVEKYAENLTYKIPGQGVTINEAMSNKDKKAFINYALGTLRAQEYAKIVDKDLRNELIKNFKKAVKEGKIVNEGILNEQKGTKVLNENTQNSKVVKGSGDTYIQLFNTIFGFEHKLGDAQWVSRTFNFVKGKFVPTTENTTENFNEDISKLIKEKVLVK